MVYYGTISCFVYYETINRELQKRLIYECRCDERLIFVDDFVTTELNKDDSQEDSVTLELCCTGKPIKH
jgi:hypothetical protein